MTTTTPSGPKDLIDEIRQRHTDLFPDLDTTGLGVTGRLIRLGSLVEQFRNRTLSEFDLTVADFDVLATLRREGSDRGVNPKFLQRSVMVTSGGMTKRLDRLEGSGLVARHPDPDDRRGTLIELTDKGRAVIDRAIPHLLGAETALMEEVLGGGAAVDRLAGLLRTLLRGLADDENSG